MKRSIENYKITKFYQIIEEKYGTGIPNQCITNIRTHILN